MDTSQLQAAVSLLQSAKVVALLPVAADDVDAVATCLALAQALRTRGARATVYPGGPIRAALSFLAAADKVEPTFEPASELTINVPTVRTSVAALTYGRRPEALEVHVTARSGAWSPREVEVRASWRSPADVMIVVGAPRLALLGPRFTKHAELFYQVPLMAIDFHAEAENFGQANVVDRTARSCAELGAPLLRHWDPALLTPAVSTALYAGLMAATESWQKSMTSPAQFELGAALLDAGADRLQVVRHLYKTKPLGSLTLWGRVLAQLTTTTTARGTRVAHAALSQADLEKSGSDLEAVRELLSSILVHATDVDLACVVAEQAPRAVALLASARGEALNVARRIGPAVGTSRLASVSIVAGSREQALQQVLRACDVAPSAGYTAAQGATQGGPTATQHRTPAPARRQHDERTPAATEAAGRQAR